MPDRHDLSKPLKARHWVTGIVVGLLALAALVAGSAYGNVHAKDLHSRLVAWISAVVLALAGVVATTRLSRLLARVVSNRALATAASAVRILTAAVGYVFVLFSVLAVLDVSITKLLVGAGLAGVVLGIAATQSLGNVFAGLVLILARPFRVGDHVRIRSGALGGIFDGWIVEMSLTYTTVRLEDGPWKIPNAAMLAAGVGQLPRTDPVPPVPQSPGAPPPGAPPPPVPAPQPPASRSRS